MIALSIIFLIASIGCYSLKELHAHSKLKWSKGDDSFWGEESYWRKYANPMDAPLENWYYKFFKIKSKERWPTSATFTVMFTDGMHLMQFLHHLLLAISLGLLFEIKIFDFNGNVQAMVLVWLIIKGTHGATYKFLSR